MKHKRAYGFLACVAHCIPPLAGCNFPSTQPVIREIQQPEIITPNNNSTQNVRAKLAITVEVFGFQNDRGRCRVALYAGSDHFNDPNHALAKKSVDIIGSKATWNADIELPVGKESNSDVLEFQIAVSAYHDENENKTLDKNSLGIPTERYGFSQNPKRGFGPPKFQEAAVQVRLEPLTQIPSANQEISINIK